MSAQKHLLPLLLALALPPDAPAQAAPHLDRHGDPLPPGAVARLGTARLRHAGDVTALAFSPDDKILATAGADHEIRLWDSTDGRPLRRLFGHTRPVRALAFSPRKNLLVSASEDGTIRFWDPAAGTEVGPPVRSFAGFVAFTPDGQSLVFADGEFTIRVRGIATGKEVRAFRVRAAGGATGIALSADGKLLATAVFAGGGSEIRLWDLERGAERRRWAGHRGAAEALAFSPDGKTLFSGGTRPGEAGELRGWDVATGDARYTFPDPLPPVASLCVSADGKYLAASRPGGTALLWELSTAAPPKLLWRDAVGGGSVAFRPDGRRLASAVDRAVRLFDPSDPGSLKSFEGHTRPVLLVGFGPDGKTVASAGERVRVWDAATGAQFRATPRRLGGLDTAALSPDRKTLATGSPAGTFLWDLATAREVRSFPADDAGARALTFTPDGKFLVGSVPTPPGQEDSLRFWDVGTGRTVRRFGKETRVTSLAFSPDGKWLAGASRSRAGLRIWDIATERQVALLINETVRTGLGESALAFSPNGKRLVAGGWGGNVRLFDPATGQRLLELLGHPGRVLAAQFSPRGELLATGDEDGIIRLWDGNSGKFLYELAGHDGEVLSVAFSPDGTRLASADADTTILLWDLPRLKGTAGVAVKAPRREELGAWWGTLTAPHDDPRRAERDAPAGRSRRDDRGVPERAVAAAGGGAGARLATHPDAGRQTLRGAREGPPAARRHGPAHRDAVVRGAGTRPVAGDAAAAGGAAGPTGRPAPGRPPRPDRGRIAPAPGGRGAGPRWHRRGRGTLRTLGHSEAFRRALAEAHPGTPPADEVRAALEKRPSSGK